MRVVQQVANSHKGEVPSNGRLGGDSGEAAQPRCSWTPDEQFRREVAGPEVTSDLL